MIIFNFDIYFFEMKVCYGFIRYQNLKAKDKNKQILFKAYLFEFAR